MKRGRVSVAMFASVMCVFALAGRSNAQTVPWEVFADPDSSSVCDLINAGNAELVLLRSTGELVIVSGTDVILGDTYVDADNLVYFDGDLTGLIAFAEDADGFRTLWWESLTGRVVDVDTFTGEPLETNLFPSDFAGVPCDACEYWDDPYDCDPAYLDEDYDGVSDLYDLCPSTAAGQQVDADGCPLVITPGPGVTVSFCGSVSTVTLAMTLCGLVGLGLMRRRCV